MQTALELLSHAIDAENNHDYTEAYAQYMAALDYLMAAQDCMYILVLRCPTGSSYNLTFFFTFILIYS